MIDRNKPHREEKEPSFSIYEFKGWLARQPEANFRLPDISCIQAKKIMGDLVGIRVEPRLGLYRLKDQIAQHNESLNSESVKTLATAFKDNGGVVGAMHDLCLVIETNKGEFRLPKLYTKPLS